jgi:hypothetical protein
MSVIHTDSRELRKLLAHIDEVDKDIIGEECLIVIDDGDVVISLVWFTVSEVESLYAPFG